MGLKWLKKLANFQNIKCTLCNGSGKTVKSKNIEFEVPRGLKNEGIIKLRRPDSKVINILVKQVKEDNFIRKNNDLFTKVNVDYLDAILGGEVVVSTLDKPISLKIPAGTKNSTLFKVKDKGMPSLNSNKLGSLIVEIVNEWADLRVKTFEERRSWVRSPKNED